METKIIYVDNMVCQSCEKTVVKTINSMKGVTRVDADSSTGQIEINSSEKISNRVLEAQLGSIGYPIREKTFKGKKLLLLIVGGLILLFLSNNQTLVEVIDLDIRQSYFMLFVVGILTSFHCVFMCGGIAMSQAVGKHSTGGNIKSSLAYNIGRVISYTIIGGIVGGIGSLVMVTEGFRGAVTIGAGLFMLLFGLKFMGLIKLPKLNKRKQLSKLTKEEPYQNNFVVGLLNGFMPCGPLQTMQLYALGTGSIVAGSLSMLAFALGTVPLMIGIGFFTSSLNRGQSARLMKISALVVMLLGLVMVNRGLALYGVNVPRLDDLSNPISIENNESEIILSEDGFQEITLIATGSSYAFEEKVIKAGIPVRINLDVQGLSRCSNPLVIPKYNITNDMMRDEPVMEFTPAEVGGIRVTCWMGMITTTLDIVE